MSDNAEPLSLQQELSHRILARLARKGLLDETLIPRLEEMVADGEMQEADWKLEFEKTLTLKSKAQETSPE